MLISDARISLYSDLRYKDEGHIYIRQLDNEIIIFDKDRMVFSNTSIPLLPHNEFSETVSQAITINTLPLIAGIKITDKCNLNCRYCFSNNNTGMSIRLNDFEIISKALRLAIK